MDTLSKISPAQSLLLRTATRRADGCVIPPDSLRGGARVKVLTALLQRGWIEPADSGHLLTNAGFAVAGRKRPTPPEAEGIQRLPGEFPSYPENYPALGLDAAGRCYPCADEKPKKKPALRPVLKLRWTSTDGVMVADG